MYIVAGLCLVAGCLLTFFLVPSATAAGSSGDGHGNLDTMVEVAPMPVPIIQKHGIKGLVVVDFFLDAPDSKTARKIEKYMPRLRDAYIRGISEFATTEIRIDRPLNLERLDFYLQRETKAVLHEDGIKILFKQAMIQRR